MTVGQKTFKTSRRVEFRDTDMARIVHFSVFFAYMEEAEHEFLRSLGQGVVCKVNDQLISWPRVNAECNYRAAIRFEEVIDIEVSVARIGSKSVTYGFQFSREGVPVADGTMTAVCCKFDHAMDRQRPQSVDVPQEIVDALTPFVRG